MWSSYGVGVSHWRWTLKDSQELSLIAALVQQAADLFDAGIRNYQSAAMSHNHAFFQFYVADGKLSCQLYQRSADIFLGVPFNIASYALLTHMLAQQCDLAVGDFIWTGGDCHIYSNHTEQVELQLGRAPYPYPTLNIKRRPDSIFDYQYEDFEVLEYQCHPAIKAPVAV